MRKTILLAGTALAMMTNAAKADGVVEPASFAGVGPYMGLQAGFAWGKEDGAYSASGTEINRPEPGFDMEGFVVGGHLGYVIQFNSIVLCVEGDAEHTGLKGDNGGYDGEAMKLEGDLTGSVRGRLGCTWESALIYATAGVAFLDADFAVTDPGEGESADYFFTGWTMGGGVDFAVTDDVMWVLSTASRISILRWKTSKRTTTAKRPTFTRFTLFADV